MKTARIDLHEANHFVSLVHRHNDPVTGHRFSIGAYTLREGIVGVAICGRPNARKIDQKNVLEILRCATNGHSNACSFLYGKAARIARELGFRAVITYTLSEKETGASLRAMGWWPEVLDERDGRWHPETGGAAPKGQEGDRKIRWLLLTGVGE